MFEYAVEVILDFRESKVSDMFAIEAVNRMTERYNKAGKKLHLRHFSDDCRNLLKNAEDVIEVNIIEDRAIKLAQTK